MNSYIYICTYVLWRVEALVLSCRALLLAKIVASKAYILVFLCVQRKNERGFWILHMSASMHIYAHVHVYIYIYIYISIARFEHLYVRVYIYIFIYICTYMYICIYIYIHMYMYTCMQIWPSINIFACKYMCVVLPVGMEASDTWLGFFVCI